MSGAKRSNELKRIKGLAQVESDGHPQNTGVLLGDEISFYANSFQLISPFDKRNLKPASYELTVGNEVMLGGVYQSLGDNTNESGIQIRPFEVAVIKTEETLNMPSFLIARWNIRVAWAYQGLLWVGGPQVDPGFAGHLFCPIYNLSDKKVLIRKGDPIAIIDFIKTTPFDTATPQDSALRYNRPPSRVILEDYKVEGFQSALRSQADKVEKLQKEVEDSVKEVRGKVDLFTSVVFVILAIVVSSISVLYLANIGTDWTVRGMDIITLIIAVLALIFAVSAVKDKG